MAKKKKKDRQRALKKEILDLREEALGTINNAIVVIAKGLALTLDDATKGSVLAEGFHRELTSAGMCFALAGMALADGPSAVLQAAIKAASADELTVGVLNRETQEMVEFTMGKKPEPEETQPRGRYV